MSCLVRIVGFVYMLFWAGVCSAVMEDNPALGLIMWVAGILAPNYLLSKLGTNINLGGDGGGFWVGVGDGGSWDDDGGGDDWGGGGFE